MSDGNMPSPQGGVQPVDPSTPTPKPGQPSIGGGGPQKAANPQPVPSNFLPNDKMPEDLSKGEKDADLSASRPEEILGVKPPDFAHSASSRQNEALEGEIVSDVPANKPKTVEPEEDLGDEVSSLPEKKSAVDELKHAAQYTGMSIKTCLLFLLMIVLVGGIIYYFFFYRGESKPEESFESQGSGEVSTETIPSGIVMDGCGITAAMHYGLLAYTASSVVPSTYFGDTNPPLLVFYSGIDTALIFGGINKYPIVDFAKYVRALAELRNVYKTDIHAILDASPSRLSTLENHISVFENTLAGAKSKNEEMLAQMAEVKGIYDSIVLSKGGYETKFFGDVAALDANSSYVSLEQFIVKYKEQVDFKSRYNAMVKLNEYYQSALVRAEARLSDIKANIDPLVTGVKVTDIVGSQIDLIEPQSSDL